MTIQQQVAERVMSLSDYDAEMIMRFLNDINPHPVSSESPKRLGAGVGVINNVDAFDKYDDEIADMFGDYA